MQETIRKVAVLNGDGTIKLQSETIPELTKGMVRISVKSSLVSPGTELKGWNTLHAQLTKPALLAKPKKFGYSIAGVVEEVGEDVSRLKKGQRVAAIGAGFALHANIVVVPQNLCIAIPEDVNFDDASYAMLLATALQAVRRAEPSFGEYFLISGLGIVGLLTGAILKLNGCRVAGVDYHELRIETAKKLGFQDAFLATDPKIADKLKSFTNGEGFDGAVVAFGGDAESAMDLIVTQMRLCPDGHHTGNVVTVGWPEFDYFGEIGKMNNIDLRRASRTGPGYHDDAWEIANKDYPAVLVRWSTLRNLELCMELLSRKEIDVSLLTTHRLPLANVEAVIAKEIKHPENMLGVVFNN